MAEFVVMPKLGFDMREGELVSWLKEVGERVEKGEVVAEIESDKATLELESQADGVLLKKLVEEGSLVPVGDNVAIVGEEGEDVSDVDGAPAEAEVEEAEADETKAQPIGAAKADVTPESDGARGEEFPGGVRATPVARRMAREHEVDLTQVSGSGPSGRVRRADVEAHLEEKPAEEPAPRPVPVAAEADVVEVPASRMRQAIGRRMVESRRTIPHFYVTTSVSMGEALALRKEINAALPEDKKVSVNDLIVKAAALALRDFPNLNATFADDKILHHNNINVGTAVAVEDGLLTVVQKNTDSSTLSTVARENAEMIERAREGKIKPDDVDGATFTVSNLGGFDVDSFVAIINPPQAAILAVGTAQKVPVVRDGEIVIGTQMKATISADHRVTDGAEAARYLQRFKELLEEPMLLLL